MEETTLERLPNNVRQQVSEIEAITGFSVIVKKPDAADPQFDFPALAVVDMKDGVTKATILHLADTIPTHILIHEIQHLHRDAVIGVDRLEPKEERPAAIRLAAQIEGDIEHIKIIPIEIGLAPEAKEYWERHYDGHLSDWEASLADIKISQNDKLALRANMLRGWLVSHYALPHWQGRQTLQNMLERFGVWRDAQNLVFAFDKVADNKARSVSVLLRFLQLDGSRFELVRFRVAEGRVTRSDVPTR